MPETLAALSGNLIPQIYRLDGVAQLTANWASLEGDNRVFQELCHLVQAEMFLPEPKIDLFVPQEDSRFIEYLKVLYRNSGEKNVRLRQLVQFPQGRGKKTRESMEFFDSILFFLASDCMATRHIIITARWILPTPSASSIPIPLSPVPASC